MKISLIQMNSQNDKPANLRTAATLIETPIRDENPQLIVLPEYFAFLDDDRNAMHARAETVRGGETGSFL